MPRRFSCGSEEQSWGAGRLIRDSFALRCTHTVSLPATPLLFGVRSMEGSIHRTDEMCGRALACVSFRTRRFVGLCNLGPVWGLAFDDIIACAQVWGVLPCQHAGVHENSLFFFSRYLCRLSMLTTLNLVTKYRRHCCMSACSCVFALSV